MGFKINYHSEVVMLLSVMTIFVVQPSIRAQASIPEPTQQTAPVPQLNLVPVPEVKPELKIKTDDLHCLAEAVYFESKNEPVRGQRAVAHVIVNRTKNSKFPGTICEVVNQKNNHTCQFSYKCDGKTHMPKNKEDYDKAKDVAEEVLQGDRDNTAGALFFHNNTVRPPWAKRSRMTAEIGNHKFYRG